MTFLKRITAHSTTKMGENRIPRDLSFSSSIKFFDEITDEEKPSAMIQAHLMIIELVYRDLGFSKKEALAHLNGLIKRVFNNGDLK